MDLWHNISVTFNWIELGIVSSPKNIFFIIFHNHSSSRSTALFPLTISVRIFMIILLSKNGEDLLAASRGGGRLIQMRLARASSPLFRFHKVSFRCNESSRNVSTFDI